MNMIIRNKLIMLLFFTISVSNAQNQFTNGGFESNLDYWMYFSTIPSVTTFSMITDSVHGGSKALKVGVVDSSAAMAAFGEEIVISPGKYYLYDFWVRSAHVEQYVMPFIQFKFDTTLIQQSYCLPFSYLNGWTRFTNRFQAPDNCNRVVLAMFCFGKGDFYFDDFSLVMLSNTTYSNFDVYAMDFQPAFKKLLQVNNGPGPYNAPNNNIRQFQELGCDYVRSHDYFFAFDHHAIFPDTARNPLDPAAYNFRTTDSVVSAIISAGGKIFYRFGESYETVPIYNSPPANSEKWAQVCVQIIKHYNDGWHHGFHYGLDYFEIWNEPDIPQFWSGTPGEYAHLYSVTSSKIKNYDTLLKVGGPAVSNIFNEKFINTFLDSVQQRQLPLDFFSYHVYYYPNPYYFKYANDYARNMLNRRNLTGVELINSEWNIYMYDFDVFSMRVCNDAINASSTLSAFNYFNETDIGKAFRYNLASYYFGLLNDDGSWRYGGLAYRTYSRLTELDRRLRTAGSDSMGTTVMAGKTLNGDMMQVVVADNSSSAAGYHLNILELPVITGNIYPYYDYEIYRMDENNMYYQAGSGSVDMMNPTITQRVKAPFADHILFYQRVGISEKENDNNLMIYPNPSTDNFTFKMKGDIKDFEVFDSRGLRVLHQAADDLITGEGIFTWDGSTNDGSPIIKGVYFLKVNFYNDLPVCKKLVKM